MKKVKMVAPEVFVKNQERLIQSGFQMLHQKESAMKHMSEFPEDTYFVVMPVGAGAMADSIHEKLKG